MMTQIVKKLREVVSKGSPFGYLMREAADEIERIGSAVSKPAAHRWRQPGNKHWIYDPTPEWIEDHKHEIELEALYTAPPQEVPENLLDFAWDRINALGGRAEQDNSYDQGFVDAIGKALEEIEKLGGKDPQPQRASCTLSSHQLGTENG